MKKGIFYRNESEMLKEEIDIPHTKKNHEQNLGQIWKTSTFIQITKYDKLFAQYCHESTHILNKMKIFCILQ